MNIYSYLKKDHKMVRTLMEQLLDSKILKERHELFEKIKYELLRHVKTEEDTFYKSLEDKKPIKENIEEAEKEHKEIEEYLEKLACLEFGSEEWIEQFGEFKHSVTHHIEEEEGAIFEKAKKLLSDSKAEKLAKEMDELKHNAKYQKKDDC